MKKKPAKAAKKIKSSGQAKKASRKAGRVKNFPIVGIGASAGGVEASAELLKNLPLDLGMAYVFIHHLSPDFDSNLTEIFQRKTSLPVVKVKDNTRVEADRVYVIPPNTFMYLEGGHLKLRSRSKLDLPYHPIDYFFMSLAQACQHNAIGIILSGTATDGTLGLQVIKEKGGITFAQDESAMHNEMSRHAQESGYVDFVLSPRRITEELASLARHHYAALPTHEELVTNEGEIKKILNIILQKKGIDFFSHYKRTTVYRRIMRRMALHKTLRLADYSKKLMEDNREVDALYHDFLINVTSFFREPAFFKALVKIVFPKLIKDRRQSDPVRIWIAGCATGEEAYSMAICLTEFLQKKKLSHPVNIFATDLNGKAVEKARPGIYSKSLVQHISAQRLNKFFIKIDGHYRIIKSIREMCIFSQHDLLKDPPFSSMDLISCQNVLIYLEPVPQKMIMQTFHYALKPSGFLLVGKSESIGSAIDLFQPTEKDSRLFTKKAVKPQRLKFGIRTKPVSPAAVFEEIRHRSENDIEKESDKILLTRYVPASVLVNKDLEIIRFRGSTAAYLEPASGKASLNLLKMVKDEMLFELRSALQEAKKTGLVASKENISIDPKLNGRAITIEVAPIKSGKDIYYLVVFKEGIEEPPFEKPGESLKPGAQKVKIQKLEQALVNAREQIRATSEDFEATHEELQSANEEILSSNEELQSINEELETSKEELQSSNEELTTINDELQNRNVELKQSRDYAQAIIETMRGPLMVLNSDMRVRTANKAFYKFFKVSMEETEGAFIHELVDRQWNVPALRDHLRDILPKKIDFKDFEINHDFPRIGNRTMIVNAHKLVPEVGSKETLILLSFEDISRYKIAEKSLMETQEQLELALVGGSVGTWSWNIRNNEIKISKEGQALYGLTEGVCRTYDEWEQLVYPDDRAPTREALKRSIEKKLPLEIEFRIIRPDKSTRWILLKANTYYDRDGRGERIVGVKIDITDRINLERQKDDFMGIASHELKTPVTSIKAYTQILQEKFRKANDVVSANMLTRLDLQIDKLTGLINTLLDVARIQSGQMDYEESYFDISEFILEVTEEIQRTSQDHTIVTDLSASGKVFGDKERITQVLTNLISNAVKYSPSSTKVFVRTQRDDSNFIISVQDFGLGISKEMQDKIFGRFFRVSEPAGNRASGLGLGLFISSEIVKQHGGKLWLESELGKGSKFFFSLPDKSE